jgi:hypothetical protein
VYRGLYIYQLNPALLAGFVYNQHAVPPGVVEAVGGVASGTIAVGGVPVLFAAKAVVSDVGSAGIIPSLF